VKRWRTTLIVAGVFAALLGYVLFVEREREPPPEPGITPSPTPASVLQIAVDNLRALRIDGGERALRLVRGGEGWEIELADGSRRPADAYAIDWRIDQLAAFEARLIVSEQIAGLQAYGLDQAALTLTLELADGSSERIAIGRSTPDGTARYVRREGDPRLYIVDQFRVEAYFEWLDQPPYPPTPTPAP
jgi:hypothetical protein